ncbi:MAG: recombinase family protein [Candidatus Ornithomonoglobus sp.]
MEPKKVRLVQQRQFKLPSLYKNVGIYCRVSSRIQEQLNSMSAQASFFVQMISERMDWKLVDIYLDFKSGEAAFNRPEFLHMLNDAKNKKLDIILTKSISRFGRNTEDTISALRELKDADVTVIFDEENIDTSTEDSELMISIISAFAEEENRSRRENQNWGIEKRLEDGTSEVYTRSCYGYQKDESGELIINSPEARVVQEIFSMYLSGKSIIGIIDELERRGIKSPKGKDKWSKRTIDTMLSNEKYVGDVLAFKTYSIYTPNHKRVSNKDGSHKKYLCTNSHPAIISKEMFDAVQEEKTRRSNVVTDASGTHRKSTKYSSKREK